MKQNSDQPYTKLEPVAKYFEDIEEIDTELVKPIQSNQNLEIVTTQQDAPPQLTFSSKRAKAIFFINLFAMM